MNILRAFLLSLLFVTAASANEIKVSVAISLKEALTEIAKEYKTAGGDDVVFTFGSSGQLATQIKNGAEVDAFISAANKQIDDLVMAHVADPDTHRVVARNALVLIVPANARNAPAAMADLADGKYKKIAIGDPKTVPAGDYAMQSFAALKLTDKVSERLVYGTNVRQVLAYVEGGDVAAGLVYATDAKQSGDKIMVVAMADEKTHEPIVYPAVVIKASKKKLAATKFLDFLKTDKAQKVLTEKGFTLTESATLPSVTPTMAPAK